MQQGEQALTPEEGTLTPTKPRKGPLTLHSPLPLAKQEPGSPDALAPLLRRMADCAMKAEDWQAAVQAPRFPVQSEG